MVTVAARHLRCLVAAFLLVLLAACRMQSLLYPVPSTPVPSPPPAPLVEVPLTAPSGPVGAWWLPTEAPGAPAILFLHGNGENIETMRRWGFFDAAATLGASVLALDYPGYGRSAGRPSEEGNVAAAQAALGWLAARPDRGAGAPILVVGWSLGAAVALQAAMRGGDDVDGLALLSPWTSLAEIAGVHYPRWLVGLALSERYDSLAAAAAVRSPVLVMHGAEDGIIPAAQGRRLAEALGTRARWVEIEGAGHNDLLGRAEVWREIRSFVGEFPPSSTTSSRP